MAAGGQGFICRKGIRSDWAKRVQRMITVRVLFSKRDKGVKTGLMSSQRVQRMDNIKLL